MYGLERKAKRDYVAGIVKSDHIRIALAEQELQDRNPRWLRLVEGFFSAVPESRLWSVGELMTLLEAEDTIVTPDVEEQLSVESRMY